MNLDRWAELKEILAKALDLPATEQSAYLSTITDEELRRQIEALLAIPAERMDVFDHVSLLPGSETPDGDQIASYVLVRELGRGGMGTVYLARDAKHDRLVALKLLFPQSARLAADEHMALARLAHHNIATLYDSGTTDTGVRYVAMEYVEGVPLGAYCEHHCPTIRSRLELFRKICAAVAYAHRNLVVHRDLKPGNILVTADGEPKLLDFGIAKLLQAETADATLTRIGERPLTVAFASPEQLSGGATTTATDIYSLGVLLCFLLTGRLPYPVTDADELPFAIRNLEPAKPSDLVVSSIEAQGNDGNLPVGSRVPDPPQRLRRSLQGDIDAIVERALRKEPDLRYATVAELAEDIHRHLAFEPVAARRGTSRYRMAKFVERHRKAVAAGASLLLLLLAFGIALFAQYRETVHERDNARREAARKDAVARFLIDMFKLPNTWADTGYTVSAQQVLDDALIDLDSAPPEDPELRGTLRQALGTIYLNLGLYTPAETLLAPALSDFEANLGTDPAELREMQSNVARLHYVHGHYREAERYARRALGLSSGKTIAEQVESRALLGHIAFARGDFRQAEHFFREVVRLQAAPKGTDEASMAGALNDLACTLHEQGRLSDARALYERSLAMRRRLFGETHADVFESLYNLARLYHDQGELPRAEELFRRAHEVRETVASYHPIRPRLLHGLGALLLERAEYDEAGLRLHDALGLRRNILPDDHPDIARSLAELGRLAHALERFRDAEFFYREGLKRLERTLGPDHPDRISVANNLAVFLAEERGRVHEAEALWRDLSERTRARPLRPHIRQTLTANLAELLRQEGREAGDPHSERVNTRASFDTLAHSPGARYRTLGVAGMQLTGVRRPATSSTLLTGAGPRSEPQTILFFDDFEDGIIDTNKWEYGGNTVTEEDGHLQVSQKVTDSGGWAHTRPLTIDPKRPLVISRRVKVYAANEYFDGALYVNIIGYPGKRWGVSYANYHYTGLGESVTVGFSLFRLGSNSHRYFDRFANASPLLPPLWGRWFDEEIRYEPTTGEVRYALNKDVPLVYNVGALPPKATSITLSVSTWGWYTGHYQHVDYMRVWQ
jgi:serine/threonine protein kinase